ncbi:lipase member K-like [Sitophilus oryzae]|uniref:Lipase n=1 Tax=Sitophilus oryzae TaxID=7048 RepID=A0A6J2Y5J0_SITOR|nr:lipase member K-like [Sitophilus oryzae]
MRFLILFFFKLFALIRENVVVVTSRQPTTVCDTREAYFDHPETNKNCRIDKDLNVSVSEIARNHGFILEKHTVETDDLYQLSTYRLKKIDKDYGNKTIFLQHGLMADFTSFIINGNNSIAFFFGNLDYDVWLGNYRDTEYCGHKYLKRSDPKYWEFSFDENGFYDLSANFKYIYQKVNKKIIYIGHSMGGTGMGVYASSKNKEAQQFIEQAIVVCPIFHIKHRKLSLFSELSPFTMLGVELSKLANYRVLVPEDSVPYRFITDFCMSSLNILRLCLLMSGIGSGPIKFDADRIPFVLKALKNGNYKSITQYVQYGRSGEFRKFDHGKKKNMALYNSTVPPPYNLSNILIPMTLIYGQTDNMANKEDVIYDYNNFKKDNWEIYGIPYNHIDLLVSRNVVDQFYPLLLNSVKRI